MKKILIALLAVFAVNANLFGSEEEQPKQKKGWNNITRAFKALAISIPIVTTGYNYVNYTTKECGIEKYPNAGRWFRSMSEKYPVADLKQAEFCEGVQWENADNRIFAHPGDLQVIEQIYDKKMKNMTLSELEKNNLNLVEFLLLHEVGHRKNGDTSVGSLGSQLAISTIVAQGLDFYTQNYAHEVIASTTAYGLNKALQTDHHLKIEARADKFACNYATDKDVLEGGLGYFNRLTILGVQDSLHPHSKDRAQKVVDEINRRRILENTCPAKK